MVKPQVIQLSASQLPRYRYMRVNLEFGSQNRPCLMAETYKLIIVEALKELYGDMGASFSVDVLKFDSETLESVLRIPQSGYVQVCSALSWLSHYKGCVCRFNIENTASHLSSLSVDSRKYEHKIVSS